MNIESPSSGQQVLAVLSAADIIRSYRETLAKDSRRMRGLVEGTVMQEIQVKPEMILAGRTLRDAELPAGCLVVSVRRGSTLLFPRGQTVILPGDTIMLLMSPQGEQRWQEYISQGTSANTIDLPQMSGKEGK